MRTAADGHNQSADGGPPGDYRWSNYRANALGETDPVITQHALYRDLAASDEARLAAYRRLFEGGFNPELLQRLRGCTNGGLPAANVAVRRGQC